MTVLLQMRRTVSTFICAFLVGVMGAMALAQVRTAPTPMPAPAVAPTLSEDDTLLVQTVQQLGKVAANACQGLETVKVYNTQRQAIAARLEAKYPGFTLDWSAMTLTATKEQK